MVGSIKARLGGFNFDKIAALNQVFLNSHLEENTPNDPILDVLNSEEINSGPICIGPEVSPTVDKTPEITEPEIADKTSIG